MRRVDISKGSDPGWEGKEAGRVVTRGDTKEECIRNTAQWAEAQGEPISVRIHLEDGTFEEERTYPRSADPPGSKG
jgi:hypothetical protein